MSVASLRRRVLLPHDRVLRLNDALGEGAEEAIRDAVVRPEYELVDCHATYLRYKPAQSCLILYRLELRDQRHRTLDQLLHLRLYAPDRCDRVWARGRIQAVAGRVTIPMPIRPAARIPTLSAIAQAYPVDVDLPSLVRVGRDRPLRYKPARKALLRIGGRFVKLYADERGARAYAAGRALAAAGAPVIQPSAYHPRLRALVHPATPGSALSSLRDSAKYADAAAEAAAAIAQVHAVRIAGLPPHTWRGELSAAATAIGVARPDLVAGAVEVARRATALLEHSPRQPVAVHGDFYDDQVVVAPTRVVLLDFDRAATGDPLADVGSFAARLIAAGGAGDAADAFVDSYAAASAGALDRRSVAAAEAGALLKLAAEPFRVLDPGWPEEVERRLELARGLLPTASKVGASAAARDPALPRLETLLDRDSAADVVSRVLGTRVDVVETALVRHRPARRATVRWRLPSSTVYAKTYASDRAPRVFRTLAALATHVDGVAVPTPLGVEEPLHLVLANEVGGEPVTQRLGAGDVELAERIAVALARFHSSSAELERRHAAADELAAVERRVVELPERLCTRAQRALAAAAAAAPRLWRYQPIHRDFYPDQVLVADASIGFLDVDDAAMSEPAVDVANFLAHLRLLALQRSDDATRLERVADAFARSAFRSDARLEAATVQTLEATTLIRLACIHIGKGRTLAEQLIASAERLESGERRWP